MKQQPLFEADQQLLLARTKEQIQEDVICFIESFGFISHPEFVKDNVCQIVCDNFKTLEK